MSHHNPIPSPPNTPLAQRSVGELVAETPSLSRVFQQHRLDFCCQGGRTVEQACEAKHLPLDAVLADLQAALAGPPPEQDNPAELPPVELVEHIVSRHHGYLRAELPRLHSMSLRVASVHGGHTPSLVEVHEVFTSLLEELDSHMAKDEEILFPAIRRLAAGESIPMPLDGPIHGMMQEHAEAGEALETLRSLTADFTPPAEACNTYRALFAGLAELETDLHRHIHLENAVLFPQAMKMAAAV